MTIDPLFTEKAEADLERIAAECGSPVEAVCISCGGPKLIAIIKCKKCGYRPMGMSDMALSSLFSTQAASHFELIPLGKIVQMRAPTIPDFVVQIVIDTSQRLLEGDESQRPPMRKYLMAILDDNQRAVLARFQDYLKPRGLVETGFRPVDFMYVTIAIAVIICGLIYLTGHLK